MAGSPAEWLERALRERFAPEHMEIADESGAHAGHAGAREGGHFRVLLVASCFAGQSLVERQRAVYGALGALRQAGIHALALRTLTPEEFRAGRG